MPRIRTIKPGFFTSPDVADLSLPARLTFIGLWTYVDDEGRGQADPRLIKAALWPLDDAITAEDVDAHLAELERMGSVSRYEVDGRPYLVVTTWEKHQKINRPSASSLPSPDDGSPLTHAPLTEGSVSAHGGKGKEGKGKEEPLVTSDDVTDEAQETFEEHFWPTYPRRNGKRLHKGKALSAWRRLTVEQRRRALIGARNLAKSDQLPPDAFRFLRKDTAGEFPFDDWQTAAPGVTPDGKPKVELERCPDCDQPLRNHSDMHCQMLAEAGEVA